MSDFVQHNSTICSFTTNSSWVVLSPVEMFIKTKIESVGTPLKDWNNIQIYRGILTGLNEAFIISSEKREEILSNCCSKDERRRTDEVIRPVLRGRDIERYAYKWAGLYLISTFPSRHYNINDYPSLMNYLLSYDKRVLAQTGEKNIDGIIGRNARKKTNNMWYETQDNISYWDDFNKQKLAYKEISQELSFSYVEENIMVLNTAYIITSENDAELMWLMSFLNSKLINWYYHIVAVQLGTATRLLYMYVVKIPIIKLDETLLKQFKQYYGNNEFKKLDELICKCYGLNDKEINYLLNKEN